MKDKILKTVGSISCSGSISNTTSISVDSLSTSTTIWKGGWVSDNFSSYYLDDNGVKHKTKPKV